MASLRQRNKFLAQTLILHGLFDPYLTIRQHSYVQKTIAIHTSSDLYKHKREWMVRKGLIACKRAQQETYSQCLCQENENYAEVIQNKEIRIPQLISHYSILDKVYFV